MVDHERHRELAEQVLELDQVGGIEVQDEMPSHRFHPLDGALEKSHLRAAAEVLHEIEAHAANSSVVHALKVFFRNRRINNGGAAIASAGPGDRVERGAHVGTVAAGVDDHGSFQPQSGMQFLQRFEGRVFRCVSGFRVVRKPRRRPEHVAVRIASEGRRFE